jgi:hypothetical protein
MLSQTDEKANQGGAATGGTSLLLVAPGGYSA